MPFCFKEKWGLNLERFNSRDMARQCCFASVPRRKETPTMSVRYLLPTFVKYLIIEINQVNVSVYMLAQTYLIWCNYKIGNHDFGISHIKKIVKHNFS